MPRPFDPARRERERLMLLERRAIARKEAADVAAGVAETVALSQARGAGIEAPSAGRGEPQKPYRRRAGLDWLTSKGRLTPLQRAAGERYGQAYRRARREGSIPSSLDVKPGRTEAGGAPLSAVLAQAEATAAAAARLAAFRSRLSHQTALVAACDMICGEELTPREAAGGEREAGRMEAVLCVALDLLAAG
jgi:hypothetical protein